MPRVLIFEDDDQLREVIHDLLVQAGFEVDVACDGAEGLRRFREDPSDLVITDIRMPHLDGHEAILEIRRGNPDVKIIAISGGGAVDTDLYMRVARKLGADASLAKPFALGDLLAAVSALV